MAIMLPEDYIRAKTVLLADDHEPIIMGLSPFFYQFFGAAFIQIARSSEDLQKLAGYRVKYQGVVVDPGLTTRQVSSAVQRLSAIKAGAALFATNAITMIYTGLPKVGEEKQYAEHGYQNYIEKGQAVHGAFNACFHDFKLASLPLIHIPKNSILPDSVFTFLDKTEQAVFTAHLKFPNRKAKDAADEIDIPYSSYRRRLASARKKIRLVSEGQT